MLGNKEWERKLTCDHGTGVEVAAGSAAQDKRDGASGGRRPLDGRRGASLERQARGRNVERIALCQCEQRRRDEREECRGGEVHVGRVRGVCKGRECSVKGGVEETRGRDALGYIL